MAVPHGHWNTTTFLESRRAIDRDAFEAYVKEGLVPELRPGDIVVMLIEDAGAQLLFLPPYSPDFNPIELAFAKLKARLRKAAERTVDGLWNAIGQISLTFSPQECKNYFNAAG